MQPLLLWELRQAVKNKYTLVYTAVFSFHFLCGNMQLFPAGQLILD